MKDRYGMSGTHERGVSVTEKVAKPERTEERKMDATKAMLLILDTWEYHDSN